MKVRPTPTFCACRALESCSKFHRVQQSYSVEGKLTFLFCRRWCNYSVRVFQTQRNCRPHWTSVPGRARGALLRRSGTLPSSTTGTARLVPQLASNQPRARYSLGPAAGATRGDHGRSFPRPRSSSETRVQLGLSAVGEQPAGLPPNVAESAVQALRERDALSLPLDDYRARRYLDDHTRVLVGADHVGHSVTNGKGLVVRVHARTYCDNHARLQPAPMPEKPAYAIQSGRPRAILARSVCQARPSEIRRKRPEPVQHAPDVIAKTPQKASGHDSAVIAR